MKILYLNDYMGTTFETPEEEWKNYNKVLRREGLPESEHREDGRAFDEQFDAMIFDWGGASLGNSLLETYSRILVNCAEENPSRIFYIHSAFDWYVKEYEKEVGELVNVFYDEESFFDELRRVIDMRG